MSARRTRTDRAVDREPEDEERPGRRGGEGQHDTCSHPAAHPAIMTWRGPRRASVPARGPGPAPASMRAVAPSRTVVAQVAVRAAGPALEVTVCAILVVLLPFWLGFALASRTAAFLVYVAAFGPVFTFQTLSLVTDWAGGSEAAFGSFPSADYGAVLGYGGVNLVLYLVGAGLLLLGRRVGAGRRARRTSPAVALDPVG